MSAVERSEVSVQQFVAMPAETGYSKGSIYPSTEVGYVMSTETYSQAKPSRYSYRTPEAKPSKTGKKIKVGVASIFYKIDAQTSRGEAHTEPMVGPLTEEYYARETEGFVVEYGDEYGTMPSYRRPADAPVRPNIPTGTYFRRQTLNIATYRLFIEKSDKVGRIVRGGQYKVLRSLTFLVDAKHAVEQQIAAEAQNERAKIEQAETAALNAHYRAEIAEYMPALVEAGVMKNVHVPGYSTSVSLNLSTFAALLKAASASLPETVEV